MTDHHARQNPLEQDTLFTTPASLMLDARLTPLERNGWQVLRMLRSAEGISPLTNLGQLRRYLTSTPLGQRAGYETARRVLVVLRLTGWISLVGQQRDPLTGHVLSELYQVHESALHFQQACTLEPVCPRFCKPSSATKTTRWIGWLSTFRQRWHRHLKPLPLRPTISTTVTMIYPLRRRHKCTRRQANCQRPATPLAARLFRNRPDTLAT